MGIELEGTLKQCFTIWLRDNFTWKYVLGLYAVSIIFFILLGGVALTLFGPIAIEVINDPSKLQNPLFLTGIIPQILTNLLVFVVVLIPLVLLYFFATYYLSILIQVRALQLN